MKNSTSECDNDLDLKVNFQGHSKITIFFTLESKRVEKVTSENIFLTITLEELTCLLLLMR